MDEQLKADLTMLLDCLEAGHDPSSDDIEQNSVFVSCFVDYDGLNRLRALVGREPLQVGG